MVGAMAVQDVTGKATVFVRGVHWPIERIFELQVEEVLRLRELIKDLEQKRREDRVELDRIARRSHGDGGSRRTHMSDLRAFQRSPASIFSCRAGRGLKCRMTRGWSYSGCE